MKITDIAHRTRSTMNNFGVKKAALFGSYARGQQNENSD
ncbi:MAG: nucleotidyltransferase domain-containing protein [Patescibacteria group bacterium]